MRENKLATSRTVKDDTPSLPPDEFGWVDTEQRYALGFWMFDQDAGVNRWFPYAETFVEEL